jgi:hypothetical protein
MTQVSQTERMVKHSRVELQTGGVGYKVAFPIYIVNRGRGIAWNILSDIVHSDVNKDQNKIALKLAS